MGISLEHYSEWLEKHRVNAQCLMSHDAAKLYIMNVSQNGSTLMLAGNSAEECIEAAQELGRVLAGPQMDHLAW
jgi:hypothetical protein